MIKSFLLFHRLDSFGIACRVTEVPATKRSARDRISRPACSLNLIQTAARVVMVNEEGDMCALWKDRYGSGSAHVRAMLRIMQYKRQKQQSREIEGARLYDHLMANGNLVATVVNQEIVIATHGTFHYTVPDGQTSITLGTALNGGLKGATIEVYPGDTISGPSEWI